jgi:hypothetical protein
VPRPPAADDLDSGLLAPVALPAFVKGAFVLGVMVRLTLWVYDRFVRSTAAGALLKGGVTRAHPSAAGLNRAVHRVRRWTTEPGMGAADDEAATDAIGRCAGQFIRNNELRRRTPGASWPGESLPVGLPVAEDRADGRRSRPRRR